jgi:protein-tyrosine-phosphatase
MSGPKSEKEVILGSLTRYINSNALDFNTISVERKIQLNEIAEYISGKVRESEPVNLTFICTHNSRRSQMSQLWAQTAALHYRIPGIRCFSGGTEATAIHPAAVTALKKAGFQIDPDGIGSNPVYRVTYANGIEPVELFSKKFSDQVNPQGGFLAIMTCSDADEACPIVPGAAARFSIPYEDPKVADNKPEEALRYDERCQQIATEMVYLFGKVE